MTGLIKGEIPEPVAGPFSKERFASRSIAPDTVKSCK